jgi:hypothetical protein
LGHFDITSKPIQGWVMVTSDGYESDDALANWVRHGVEFALSLLAK